MRTYKEISDLIVEAYATEARHEHRINTENLSGNRLKRIRRKLANARGKKLRGRLLLDEFKQNRR